jgi:hypothetical protein
MPRDTIYRQGAIAIVMFTSSSRNTIIKRKKGWCHVEILKHGRQSIIPMNGDVISGFVDNIDN